NIATNAAQSTGTLYRGKAQPIPGQITWIDREKLSLNTALGALTLPREGLTRYIYSTEFKDGAEALDEITLRDGSIFKGKTTLAGENIDVSHALLGKMSFPLGALRSLVRALPSVDNCRSLRLEQTQVDPLIGVRM